MTAQTAPTQDDDVADITQMHGRSFDVNGVSCHVNRLRTREFFALMRVLIGGLGPGVQAVFRGEAEDMPARMAGALGMAIPVAENQWLLFCKRIVEADDPDLVVGQREGKKGDKPITAKERVIEGLENPSLDETMEIVEILVEQESGDMTKLGKAMKAWWETNKGRIPVKVEAEE